MTHPSIPLFGVMMALAFSPVTLSQCSTPDADADGYAADVDCDDSDPDINPGATEPCKCDNIDQDCDGDPQNFACDIACPDPGGVGAYCGGDYGECQEGLVCCYPCGIEGCTNVCQEPCYDDWCMGGCPLLP